MPKVNVVDFMGEIQKEFDVETGTKPLMALIALDVDTVRTCGGNAKCTTCRVKVRKGVPTRKTRAQQDLFQKKINS